MPWVAVLAALWACDLANDGHDESGSSTTTTTTATTTDGSTTTDGTTSTETTGTDATTGGGPPPTGTGTTGTGGAQTTGAGRDCLGYCACLVDTCSIFVGYPYGNAGECIDVCETLDDATFACLTDACAAAQLEGPNASEQECEEAWGEPGVSSCS